ncbi:MAG: hypothetical protein KKF44_04590 [Nanoarchaeota archaeon]|nr:hypothetical protein [Nanoarchaeota archaeon]
MKNYLKVSLIAGLVAFFLELPNFLRLLGIGTLSKAVILSGFVNIIFDIYALVSILEARVILIIAYTVYVAGFIGIGRRFKKRQLLYLPYVWMIHTLLLVVLRYFALNQYAGMFNFFGGLLSIFWGMALMDLEEKIGMIAYFAGLISVIMGIAFVTVVLRGIGNVLLVPSWILELNLMYIVYIRYDKKSKKKNKRK